MKEWSKIYHTNATPKKADGVILLIDKMDFKSEAVKETGSLCNDRRFNLTNR